MCLHVLLARFSPALSGRGRGEGELRLIVLAQLTMKYGSEQRRSQTLLRREREQSRRPLLIALLATCVLIVATLGAAAEPVAWLTGGALQQQLEQPVSGSWSRISLRRALKRFARSVRVAIVLDRRVDPSRSLELTLQPQPLETALEQIAAEQKIGVAMLGPVAYFGPPETTVRLRTASALQHEALAKLPLSAKRKLLQAKAWRWADATEPTALLAQLAKEAGVKIAGHQLVQHDLWTETDLPALAWIDRLALVAIQFDLTFTLSDDGRTVTLVPLPAEVVIAKTYPGGSNAAQLAAKWQREFPDVRITTADDKLTVTGRVEDHQRIEQKLKPATTKRPERATAGEHVYTIAQDNVPLDKLLEQLAKQIGLEVRYDDAIAKAGVALDQRVSLKVKQVSLAKVLEAALAPAGLTCTIRGKVVEVRLAD